MWVNKSVTALLSATILLSTPTLEAKMTAAVTIGKKAWCPYKFQDHDFVVELPAAPQSFTHKSQLNNLGLEVDSRTYFSDDKNTSYFVIVTQYPATTPIDFEGVFQRTLDAAPDVEVVDMKRAEFKNHDTLAFLFTRDDMSIRGMYLEKDHTLYQVFAVFDNCSMTENSNRFLSSFKLTK